MLQLIQGVRLVIVPTANPDGRSRATPEAVVGRTGKDLRYWGQGSWAGGKLCGWPECKQLHPIQDAGFLGGYFTDDHINIMHDNFFHLMARETQVLLDLWAEEQADVVLHLHGGSNAMGELLRPYYVPVGINEAILSSARRCYDACIKEGLAFNLIPPPAPAAATNPPTFNLACAVHHVCGAISAVFESNECITDEPGMHYTHAQLIRSHMILFEETFAYIK